MVRQIAGASHTVGGPFMTEVTPPPEGERIPTFAEETRLRAHEVLTELNAQATSIEGQIESLRIQLESVGRQRAEAQIVLDALDGKLTRIDPAQAAPAEVKPFPVPARTDRPRWGMPEVGPPTELFFRADEFLSAHEGTFTFGELQAALVGDFPLDKIEPHEADTVLSTLMNAGRVEVDHEATGADSRTHYRVVASDDEDDDGAHVDDDGHEVGPGYGGAPEEPTTEPPEAATDELESARSGEGGVQPKSESARDDEGEGATPGAAGGADDGGRRGGP